MSSSIVFLLLLLFLFSVVGESGKIVNVFSKGESGYFCIKIPSLLVTQKGTLIAFGEARMKSCSDYTGTDLVMKRSYDGGNTWGPMKVLYSNSTLSEMVVIGNAAPVQLRSGRILIPFCRNNLQVLLTYSDDDGITWSSPRNLTGVTHSSWTWVGTGPPSALQLKSGRVVVPSYHSYTPDDDGEFSNDHMMISDDDGETWYISGNISYPKLYPNECQVVEVKPDVLYLNSRGLLFNRLQSWSFDGGLSWSKPELIQELLQPFDGCEGSTIRDPNTGTLYYSGLSEKHIVRTNLTLWTSADSAKSWQLHSVIDPSYSAYSSLAFLPSGNLSILYERAFESRIVFIPDYISFQVLDQSH